MPAFFNHQFAVANRAGDFAGRVNHQLLAHGQVAVELTANFGDVDFSRSLESALLGNLDDARIHGRFYRAFNYQRVAVGDFNALELDVGPDRQLAAAFLVAAGSKRGGLAAGRLAKAVLAGHGLRRRMRRTACARAGAVVAAG